MHLLMDGWNHSSSEVGDLLLEHGLRDPVALETLGRAALNPDGRPPRTRLQALRARLALGEPPAAVLRQLALRVSASVIRPTVVRRMTA